MDLEKFSRRGSHEWSLSYDPAGANGNGEITFVLDGETHKLSLEDGHKADGAVFDRFGMLNVMFEAGGPIEVYFDDLVIDGDVEDFRRKPADWEGVGNNARFPDCVQDGNHDYGYSAKTNHAGGESAGEIGGITFRQGPWSCFADPQVGPLSLEDTLEVRGKVALTYATSDSAAMIGWFDSRTFMDETDQVREAPPNFVGVLIEGPSRIGHYFRPVYETAGGMTGDSRKGPVIFHDGKSRDFSIRYDPQANDGLGRITVTLDGESVQLDLPAGHKADGARFDRFGILSWQSFGGHFLEVFYDDMEYTVNTADGSAAP
jgi:hypothetical protein